MQERDAEVSGSTAGPTTGTTAGTTAGLPPSGRQFELSAGPYRAGIAAVGATLRFLERDGSPLVDGFGPDSLPSGGRGQSLLPWPNRIDGGSYTFQGRTYTLALSEPAKGNAIHGLLRWVPWQAAEVRPDAVTLRAEVAAQPGYPSSLDVQVEYRLSQKGLTVVTTVRNTGRSSAPFGAAVHPYLSAGAHSVDETYLQFGATTRVLVDERSLPTGDEQVADTPYDFSAGKPVGDVQIDHAFGGLRRDSDGLFRVRLRGEYETVVWQDDGYPWLQIYTSDTLSGAEFRRSVAVEPMTCPPNAFVSGRDVVVLEPGETWTGTWGISSGSS